MIRFYGDIHRAFGDFEEMIAASGEEVCAHIQVGDLGLWPLGGLPPGTYDLNPAHSIYFIDGNWDYFPWLRDCREPTELMPNVIYVPRGTILELDGRRVAFLGGAKSISRRGRTEGVNWWPEEEVITMADVRKFRGERADLLVTHSPPASAMAKIFKDKPPPRPRFHGHVSSISEAVTDMAAEERAAASGAQDGAPTGPPSSPALVDRARELLGDPVVVSGHLHRSAHFPDDGVYVLDEMEVLDL